MEGTQMNPLYILRDKYRFFRLIWLPQLQRYWALKKFLPKSGIFLEAGAHDGLTQSNTIGLEKWSKWTGILVEPIPELAEKCRKNRKNAIVEECALVDPPNADKAISIWSCGLMSVIKGSHSEEGEHLKKGSGYQNIKPTLISVEGKTIANLLKKHGITQLDFLSLDLEGYEENALRGLEDLKPLYMLIESPNQTLRTLIEVNYQTICHIGQDTLFKRKNEA